MVDMSTQDHSPASSTSSSTASPRRIVVITTGGTIACTTDRSGALTPTISGTELVAAVAQRYPEGMLELEVRELGMLDSSNLAFTDVDRVLAAIHEVLDDDSVDGVVVTHGTDTMEETAMAADIFHADSRPVVFTGAQLPYDHPETDGPGNLFEAVTIASDASAQELAFLLSLATQSCRYEVRRSGTQPILWLLPLMHRRSRFVQIRCLWRLWRARR